MTDLPGEAMFDYYNNNCRSRLYIHNKYGPKEEMPLITYFRNAASMPELETIALERCSGKVLDIGAGAGSHSLQLQQQGLDVTALDISPKAAAVMKLRGVRNIGVQDFFSFNPGKFDTLLLLMNGIGIAANISGLRRFLQHAKLLLNPHGQLLFDSSDVAYLYEGNQPETDNYYGEIWYRYDYRKQKTNWFSWLYIDKVKLASIARIEGWKAEVLYEDLNNQYLAKLVMLK